MPNTADLAAALLRTPSKQQQQRHHLSGLRQRLFGSPSKHAEVSPTRVCDYFADDVIVQDEKLRLEQQREQQLVSVVLFHDSTSSSEEEDDDDILELEDDEEDAIMGRLNTHHHDNNNLMASAVETQQLVCTPILRTRNTQRMSRTHHLLYEIPEHPSETDDDLNNTSSHSLRSFTTSSRQESSESSSSSSAASDDPNNNTTTIQSSDYDLLRNATVRMPKKPVANKPTKLEKIQEWIHTAESHKAIGNEDQSINFYQKAYKLADATVAKLKHSLNHTIDTLHEKTRDTAKARISEEMTQLSQAAITIQTELALLYEITTADYKHALAAIQQAISIAKNVTDSSNNNKLQRLYRRLKHAERTFATRKHAMEHLLQLRADGKPCLEAAKDALRHDQEALGGRHSHIGDWYIFLANIDPEQKQAHLLQAYDIHKAALGSKHPRTGNDLLLLAKLESNTIPESLQFYQSAADIFCHVDDASRIVASLLNDMGVLHLALQEVDIALQLFTHSLDLITSTAVTTTNDDSYSSSNDDQDTCQVERFQVIRNIAECQSTLLKYEAAIQSFREALSIQRALRKQRTQQHVEDLSLTDSQYDDDENGADETAFIVTDESIADTLRRLGKTYLAAKQYDEAILVLQESTDIYKASLNQATHLVRAGLSIALPAKQDEVAATLYHVAQYHEAVGAYDEAIRVYNESMQLRIASDSQATEKRNLVHCAMCLTGLANVCFRQGNFMEAYNTYNRALFFCEAQNIPFENPLVRMIVGRRQLAESCVAADAPDRLEERAKEERIKGNCDQAIITLGEAVALRQTVLQKCEPGSERAEQERTAIVRLLQTCREIFMDMGDKKKAERARKEAAAISKLTRQRGRRIAAAEVPV